VMTVDRERVTDRARRAARAGGSPLGAGALAGLIGLSLMLFGPPGGDQAAHLYLTQAWRDNGWQLWDNLWYSGRYAQVNYSLLFYPLAALLHPVTVVAASCAGAAAAFAALLRRRWPAIATMPALAFAVLVPLAVVAGTYPFLLGLAFALGALMALDAGARGLAFGALLLTALAHPLALAFLLVALAAIALSAPGWWRSPRNAALAAGAVAIGGAQGVLLRGFSTKGSSYPFDSREALAIAGFCIAGLLLTRLPVRWPRWTQFAPAYAIGAVAMMWTIERVAAFA